MNDIPIRRGNSIRVPTPICNIATDPVSVDWASQLLIERNQLHGELTVARWIMDTLVNDHAIEVRNLKASIAERDAEIERLKASASIQPTIAPDPLPAWHQPNPLPRGMR